ncbi:hypothetical protein [Streptomyces sp. 8N706]|uniref:hypothetical protein n=1 Tax=Streptomyces sp. 8N706 TaxID=3457416 RepID=UPI003FD3CD95
MPHPTDPTTRIPSALRARWSDLPRLSGLAARRLGPPPLHPCTRPTAWGMWLFALTLHQAGGGLLAYGSATATVTGPRITWPRRTAQAALFLTGCTLLGCWLNLLWTLPALTAAHLPGASPLAYLTAAIATAPLPLETANLMLHARHRRAVRDTVRHLRHHHGRWWEAANLAADESDPVSAGRLIHACLAHADTARVGLVAAPATAGLHRTYRRLGFQPGPLDPRVLIRHPRPGHPPAASR